MHQGSSARLYILCGPTAVGKGTVVGSLRAQYPGKFYLSISATTRQPRPGEVNGQSYFFVDREQFIRDRDAGQMLEWAEVHGQNFYGTPAAPVDEALAQGLPVLLEIDLAGARQVKAQRSDAYGIFLAPPSWEELVRRLTGRGTENASQVEHRLATARVELEAREEADFVIVNDRIEDTAQALIVLMGL